MALGLYFTLLSGVLQILPRCVAVMIIFVYVFIFSRRVARQLGNIPISGQLFAVFSLVFIRNFNVSLNCALLWLHQTTFLTNYVCEEVFNEITVMYTILYLWNICS